MAKPVDHFGASDVTFWGVCALIVWAVAILGSNVSALMPSGLLGGLHASRLDAGGINQLRGDIVALRTETARLKQENTLLLQRFMLNEQASGDVTRRVGALELTVPNVIEALNSRTGVDLGTTASTGGEVTTFLTEGGSVSYSRTPMGQTNVEAPVRKVELQPMPAELQPVPNSAAFGIALGPPINADEGEAAWRSMAEKVGPLLLGLGPLLANVEGGAGKRLVVGPIAGETEARQLCGRMAKVGIACASVPFVGAPLPLN